MMCAMGDFSRPFRAADSGVAGPRRAKFQRVLRGIYVDPSVELTAAVMADAAWLYGRGAAVLGGRSAAAALGVRYLDDRRRVQGGYERFDPEPAVLIRPRAAANGTCQGLTVHRMDLPEGEVVQVRGMRATSPARTGFDIGRWPASARAGWDASARADLDLRVATLDALCNSLRVDPARIADLAAAHPRAGGMRRLREALALVDGGADSPPETHLRLLLIRSGLPRPQTQVPIRDERGRVFAHLDLGWPEWKVGLEYDGSWHRESPVQVSNDINRYATFEDTGWRVLTVDKWLLYTATATLIDRAWRYLEAAGAPT